MSLLDDYAADFDEDVKQRGRDWFRRKAVEIVESDDLLVSAIVHAADGDHEPLITLEADTGPRYECTCDYIRKQGRACEHCWATLLQAQVEDVLPIGEEVIDEDDAPVNAFGAAPFRRIDPSQRPLGKPEIGSPSQDPSGWKRQLKHLTQQMKAQPAVTPPPASWPVGRRILYLVDKAATMEGRGLVIELSHETPKKDGKYDRPKQLKIGREQIASLPDPIDRQILQMLLGARRGDWGFYGYYDSESPRRFELPESAYLTTLRQMCDTGRCRLRRHQGDDHPMPLTWDDGPAWEFWLEVKPSPGGRYLVLDASLRRNVGAASASANGDVAAPAHDEIHVGENGDASAAVASDEAHAETTAVVAEAVAAEPVATAEASSASEQRMPISEADLLVRGGLVFAHGRVARLQHFDAFDLIIAVRGGQKLSVPLADRNELLKMLFAMPRLPRLDLPEDMRLEEVRPAPRPRLTIKKLQKSYDDRLVASVAFDYGGKVVTENDDANALLLPDDRRVLFRDARREAEYIGKLHQLGFREAWDYTYNTQRPTLRLPQNKLPRVVAELTRDGWHVEAEGKLYRQPGELKINVKSGIDWFELHGEVSFGDVSAPLPRLLSALRRGETSVRLDDGTFGLLPQEWLKKYAGLAGMGEEEGDHLRFHKRQVGFLDALLSSMPEARFDETYERARDELMRFSGIEALDAPQGFQGELRAYQRDGLGWMSFLRRFGFGGVLADDMGLGKTVQVLALLEARRQMREAGSNGNGNGQAHGEPLPAGMSLVVAPRSLVFNWKQEAERFCPKLRVLDHTSVAREKAAGHFQNYDLILTTYGTLRRDMAFLKDVRFDYAVLDEAQAIKNASSESAKAARLLQADHRLALSGTPVQNHLGELWSLFEFLNPGMMGSAAVFKDLTGSAAASDPAARQVLAKSLRPFILRRTKEQVAKDLPEKLEQTVFCELESEQRRVYNELRDYYRTSLLERIAREGMNKAKIQVLEALLRLRQAACHPALIDKTKIKEGSAKLDALLEHISDVIDEGHKVLVFSQFTSFLAIVRDRLDASKTIYEYLDGKTRDRQARVERFQNDPECKLFLISLKAGGLGLNLTAAEYVFLLDPWWNPAVEAQAIDRAHRIGQTQKVFAYRLIAKDTVEEKVLQLQQSKKDLADAIINADNSLIRTLKRDDLNCCCRELGVIQSRTVMTIHQGTDVDAAFVPPLEHGDRMSRVEFERRAAFLPESARAELIDGMVFRPAWQTRTLDPTIPPLENGDYLSRAEFERRWQNMPELKRAELINGVVYMSPPVSASRHGIPHSRLMVWLGNYWTATPGTVVADNSTLRLANEDDVQPDAMLLIDPSCGGRARFDEDGYVAGVPELIVEVSASSVSYDLHQKLEVYQAVGVSEYIALRTLDRAIQWFVLRDGRFEERSAGEAGVHRSGAFPGLWLDAAALLRGDLAAVMTTLRRGLATPEHAAFVDQLKARQS